MKSPKDGEEYFFVDESGDPYFYNRYRECVLGATGCSPILILGFIRTQDPKTIRQEINKLKEEVQKDTYLTRIPSLKKTSIAFHAKNDCPEVREKMFKLIKTLDFKCEMVVARKSEEIFIRQHKQRPNQFYNDMVTKLFVNQLHRTKTNVICFASRTNKAREIPLENAINAGIGAFEGRWKIKTNTITKIVAQASVGEPCLQITDYMLWALQRAYIKREDRYIEFLQEKISLITDLYDFAKYPNNYYNRRNKFELGKITPLDDYNKKSPQQLVCT